MSLDANRAFELTLGKPLPGAYRASLLLGKPESSASTQERWLATSQLTVASEANSPSQSVQAREYDLPKLFATTGACAAVWAVLVVVCLRAGSRPTADLERSREKENSG